MFKNQQNATQVCEKDDGVGRRPDGGGNVEASRNRNAQRSVRLLEEALTLLIAEKPYDKITVSDITRRADLNRGTFYAHFDSVDQLMRQTMDDLTEKVSASIDPLVTNSFFQDPMPFLRQISDFVCDNLALTRKLVDNDRLGPFLGALMDRIERHLHDIARSEDPEGGNFPLETVDFLLGGIRNAYASWLEGAYGNEGIDDLNQSLCAFIKAVGVVLERRRRERAGGEGGED